VQFIFDVQKSGLLWHTYKRAFAQLVFIEIVSKSIFSIIPYS